MTLEAREIGERLPGELEQEAVATVGMGETAEACMPAAVVAADMGQTAEHHLGAVMAAAEAVATAEMVEKAIYTVLAAAVVTARWELVAREAAPTLEPGKMAVSLPAVVAEARAAPAAPVSR